MGSEASFSSCPECGQRPRRARGRRCSECHAAYMRQYRENHGGEYLYLGKRAKKRAKIRSMLRSRIARGSLKRLPCDRCGHKQAAMRVENYAKPLESLIFRCLGCR